MFKSIRWLAAAIVAAVCLPLTLAMAAEPIILELDIEDQPLQPLVILGTKLIVEQEAGPIGQFADGPLQGGGNNITVGRFTVTPENEDATIKDLRFSCINTHNVYITTYKLWALADEQNSEQELGVMAATDNEEGDHYANFSGLNFDVLDSVGRTFEVRADISPDVTADNTIIACGIAKKSDITVQGRTSGNTLESDSRNLFVGNFGYAHFPLEIDHQPVLNSDVQNIYFPEVIPVPNSETHRFEFDINTDKLETLSRLDVMFNYKNPDTATGTTGAFYWKRDRNFNNYFGQRAGWGNDMIELVDAYVEHNSITVNGEFQHGRTSKVVFLIRFNENFPLYERNSIYYYLRHFDPITNELKTSPSWTKYTGGREGDDGYFKTEEAGLTAAIVSSGYDLLRGLHVTPGTQDTGIASFKVRAQGDDLILNQATYKDVDDTDGYVEFLADNRVNNLPDFAQNCRLYQLNVYGDDENNNLIVLEEERLVSLSEEWQDNEPELWGGAAITFDFIDVIVPEGEERTFEIRCDIPTNALSNHSFATKLVDLFAESAITADTAPVFEEFSGDLLTENYVYSPETVIDAPPSLQVRSSYTENFNETILRDGATYEVGKYDFVAENANLLIDKVSLIFDEFNDANLQAADKGVFTLEDIDGNELASIFAHRDEANNLVAEFLGLEFPVNANSPEELIVKFEYSSARQADETTKNLSFRIADVSATEINSNVRLSDNKTDLTMTQSRLSLTRFAKPVFSFGPMNSLLEYKADEEIANFNILAQGNNLELNRLTFFVNTEGVSVSNFRLVKNNLETLTATTSYNEATNILTVDLVEPLTLVVGTQTNLRLLAQTINDGQFTDDSIAAGLLSEDLGTTPFDKTLSELLAEEALMIWSDLADVGHGQSSNDYYDGTGIETLELRMISN